MKSTLYLYLQYIHAIQKKILDIEGTIVNKEKNLLSERELKHASNIIKKRQNNLVNYLEAKKVELAENKSKFKDLLIKIP